MTDSAGMSSAGLIRPPPKKKNKNTSMSCEERPHWAINLFQEEGPEGSLRPKKQVYIYNTMVL